MVSPCRRFFGQGCPLRYVARRSRGRFATGRASEKPWHVDELVALGLAPHVFSPVVLSAWLEPRAILVACL